MIAIHLFVVPYWTIALTKMGVCGLAFWRGDWRTRAIASVQVASLAWHTLRRPGRAAWPVESLREELVIDSILLVVCLAAAARGRHYWTIAAAAIALAGWLTDVVALLGGASQWAYLSAWVVWSYLLSAILLWGIWTTTRERRTATA